MSPIHDQTYRRYEGQREPAGKTWTVIAWAGIRNMLQKRAFLGLLIFAWVPFLVLVMSCTMLALSSLSNSPRYVAILYTGAIFFTSAIFGALVAITGGTRVAWISITSNVSQVTDAIFRQPPGYESPWQVSLIVLLALIALSISVLERRVKGVEVVS